MITCPARSPRAWIIAWPKIPNFGISIFPDLAVDLTLAARDGTHLVWRQLFPPGGARVSQLRSTSLGMFEGAVLLCGLLGIRADAQFKWRDQCSNMLAAADGRANAAQRHSRGRLQDQRAYDGDAEEAGREYVWRRPDLLAGAGEIPPRRRQGPGVP